MLYPLLSIVCYKCSFVSFHFVSFFAPVCFAWHGCHVADVCVAVASVVGVSNERGPSAGFTRLFVFGTDFVDLNHLLAVRFGTSVVPATYSSSTVVLCVTPPHDTGDVLVDVTYNAQQYTTSSVHYSYQG